MLANLTSGLDFQSQALVLRAQRQQVIASNIANADTPGYSARDFNFAQALAEATGQRASGRVEPTASACARPHQLHLPLTAGADSSGAKLAYAVQGQPSLDGNSVDLDRERANFVDNSVRYEATLRFINGHAKTILSAIQGQ